jgi:HPt (histidine-containing phosphotransfer) domain-containing protein
VSAQPHSDDENLVDMSVIESLKELGGDDDPNLVFELIEMFLSDTPLRMRDIKSALASGDLKLLERAAHTLKSSSANVGALGLSELAKAIEERARGQHLSEVPSLFARSSAHFDRVAVQLRSLKG